MIVYGALERRDPSGLAAEMERIRKAERLDILTLTDDRGSVFYRTCNPSVVGDDQSTDLFVQYVLKKRAPASSTDIVGQPELVKNQQLAIQAPWYPAMAGPAKRRRFGMMLREPLLSLATGRFVGVMVGAVLINPVLKLSIKSDNRFQGGGYEGQPVGNDHFPDE
jgi:hypothetical protein